MNTTRDELRENVLREDANEHQPDDHGPDICGDPDCFATCVVDGCDWPCATAWLRDQLGQAEERIKAVRALHTGITWPGVTDKPICDECDQPWPCPTIRALEA